MRRTLLLTLAIASSAAAQTPQELLRLSQDTYKSSDGYEISGVGTVQPVGSSWKISFEVVVAATPPPPGSPQLPTTRGVRIGKFHYLHVGDGTDEKPLTTEIPFSIARAWNRIADNVDSVKEIGSETLPLNGATADCRVLEVGYKVPPDEPRPAPVLYSICSEKHLVLKKTMQLPTGSHNTGLPATWTVIFNTAKFNKPAPQWVLDMKDWPTLTIRKEWLGHKAPEFELPDLNGNPVALSSLHGMVVLLDFWSISCGPCLKEIPTIQMLRETHKADLTVWGVSFDQPERDRKWLLEHERSLPTLSDTNFVVSDLYKVHGIPALVLIGKDGKVKRYWQGEVPQAELETAIAQVKKK